ncbi:MAG: Unknown protein [uncultured Sulfurovum sp.]|uniref:T2SS protein K first SAM-like domain-containing protein n=1 Tax=uncultured Sulfurovum sp. TaxID=269237 RepID=A0A6S6TKE6_9BACT|nr:MAG: Unknown protein [uncultured Sulfurovum sp.]
MKKGFALALTLWIVAIMSLVTALYLSYGKKTVHKTIALEKKLQAILEVESTVELVKFYGMTGKIESTNISNNNLKKVRASFPTRLSTDGREIRWGNQTITIQDVAGLIGTGDTVAVSNYLVADENTSKDKKVIITKSMNDWLDSNGIKSFNGAEEEFYANSNLGYSPRNENYFSSIDELFLLRGVVDSNVDKKKLKSKLVLSSYPLRNILIMDLDTLGQIYLFSKIELAQLKKAKQESFDLFVKLFYQFRPEELSNESTGVNTSRIMKITIVYGDGDIRERVSFLISFRFNEFFVSEVLEYNI